MHAYAKVTCAAKLYARSQSRSESREEVHPVPQYCTYATSRRLRVSHMPNMQEMVRPRIFGNHASMAAEFFFPSKLHLCFLAFGSSATTVAVLVLTETGGLS